MDGNAIDRLVEACLSEAEAKGIDASELDFGLPPTGADDWVGPVRMPTGVVLMMHDDAKLLHSIAARAENPLDSFSLHRIAEVLARLADQANR